MSKKNREINQRKNKLGNVHLQPFEAQTDHQEDFIRSVAENDITVVYGPAGTGKSFMGIGLACQYLVQGRVQNILYSKTIIGAGDIGTLPGSCEERIHPYILPALEYFYYFIGGKADEFIHNDVLRMYPAELLRGHTYNNSLLIADESQNFTPRQLKMFMSRLGKDSKMIILGDERQSDINYNGLGFVCKNLRDIPGLNFIQFDNSDILRSGIIGDILNRFEANGV